MIDRLYFAVWLLITSPITVNVTILWCIGWVLRFDPPPLKSVLRSILSEV